MIRQGTEQEKAVVVVKGGVLGEGYGYGSEESRKDCCLLADPVHYMKKRHNVDDSSEEDVEFLNRKFCLVAGCKFFVFMIPSLVITFLWRSLIICPIFF